MHRGKYTPSSSLTTLDLVQSFRCPKCGSSSRGYQTTYLVNRRNVGNSITSERSAQSIIVGTPSCSMSRISSNNMLPPDGWDYSDVTPSRRENLLEQLPLERLIGGVLAHSDLCGLN